MLKVEKGGDAKLYAAHYQSKSSSDYDPPFGYIFAKDESEALAKALVLAKAQTRVAKANYERSRKKWQSPITYAQSGYPDPKKKTDVFVIEVAEDEIVL